jgi:hypothetical protein
MSIYPEELIPEEEHSDESSNSSTSSSSLSKSLTNSRSSVSSKSSSISSKSSNSNVSSKSSTSSNTSSSVETDDVVYLYEGRLKNGIENMFDDLPIPRILLNDKFFEEFSKKPKDFDEAKAIYFRAGF